jgi:hypothetical protein
MKFSTADLMHLIVHHDADYALPRICATSTAL